MEDTCNFKECLFAKKLKLKKPDECFNYIESWWKPDNGKENKLLKDCSNRRLFIMVQDLYNRLGGVQSSQEQMRDNYKRTELMFGMVADNIKLGLTQLAINLNPDIIPEAVKRIECGKNSEH